MSAHRSSALAKSWRYCALAVLVLWVAALGICASHCSLGGIRIFSSEISCHSATASCHGDDSTAGSNNDTSPGPVCYALKSLFAGGEQAALSIPLSPVFETARIVDPLAAEIAAVRIVLRHDDRRELNSTPEVSLGPALHSLAPPFTC